MTPGEALAPMICAVIAVACSNQSQNTKPVLVAQTPAAASIGSADPGVPKVDPALVKQGYRVARRQGKLLYCQTQTVTGTKFANTTCMTAEQIHELNRETEQAQRLLNKSGYTECLGPQCKN